MTAKPKPPARPVPKPKGPAAAKPLPQPAARWQRTVRYGWDKGGSRGGR